MNQSATGGNVHEGNLELSAMDEVATADAARRARERIELINLLSQPAGGAQNLCCNDFDFEPGIGQSGAGCCDGPRADQGLGEGSRHSADSQTDSLDGGCRSGCGGFLDSGDHRGEESEFVHSPMMPGSAENGR